MNPRTSLSSRALIAATLVSAAALTGCGEGSLTGPFSRTVAREDEPVTIVHRLPPLHTVRLGRDIPILIEQGTQNKLTIHGPADVVAQVKHSISDGMIRVRWQYGSRPDSVGTLLDRDIPRDFKDVPLPTVAPRVAREDSDESKPGTSPGTLAAPSRLVTGKQAEIRPEKPGLSDPDGETLLSDEPGSGQESELNRDRPSGTGGEALIRLTLTDVDKISATLDCEILCLAFETQELEVSLAGNAMSRFERILIEQGKVLLSGTSRIQMSGHAAEQVLALSGDSLALCRGFRGNSGTVVTSGGSRVTIGAFEKLIANASGSGAILYEGDPLLHRNASGTTRIEPLAEQPSRED